MMQKILPWVFVVILLAVIGWQCHGNAGSSKADRAKDSLVALNEKKDSVIHVIRVQFHDTVNHLNSMLLVKGDSQLRATNVFEKTGSRIFHNDSTFRVARGKKDTAGQLTACADNSVELYMARWQYWEMKRLKDSVTDANEYLQHYKDTHIAAIESDQDTSSQRAKDLSAIYDVKKAEKVPRKGLWGWLVAAIEFALLIFKK